MAPRVPVTPASEAERRLVMIALPMVERCAEDLARLFHPRVTREEMRGPGTVGAHAASARYREDKHPSFPIYARHRIRGAMLDAIRVEHVSLRGRVEHAMERAYEEFSAHQVVDADLFSDPVETIVAGAREGGDDALAAAFFAAALAAQGVTLEDVAVEIESQRAALALLTEAVASLTPLEREVIQGVYEKNLKLDDIAVEACVSPSTAQRRHVSALRKLREFLVERGMTGPRLFGLVI